MAKDIEKGLAVGLRGLFIIFALAAIPLGSFAMFGTGVIASRVVPEPGP